MLGAAIVNIAPRAPKPSYSAPCSILDMGIYCTAGQATDENMAQAHCMLHT